RRGGAGRLLDCKRFRFRRRGVLLGALFLHSRSYPPVAPIAGGPARKPLSAANSAAWVGAVATTTHRQLSAPSAAATAGLRQKALTPPQAPPVPAAATNLTKAAAVRGEKKRARSSRLRRS